MQFNWDFSGGEAEFRKALELDPSDATAHQWLAENLGYISGRAQESIEEANRAHQLDPLSPIIGVVQGEVLLSDRQFDKAIEVEKKVLADNPTFLVARMNLAGAYLGKHEYQQAIQELKTAAQLAGDKNFSEFAAALDAGFRAGGGPGALRKAIEVSLAQRKAKAGYLTTLLFLPVGQQHPGRNWCAQIAHFDPPEGFIGKAVEAVHG
jgi:tetratricopeptide (TPR) repeat protein